MLRRVISSIVYRSRRLWLTILRLPHQIINSPYLFGDRYILEDNTQVILYTDHPELLPKYSTIKALRSIEEKQKVAVSLIATTCNEKDSLASFFVSVFGQTRLPDEIVVVDAGSRDGTGDLLMELSARSPVPMKVFIEPGANISRGRNVAISHTRFPIIAAVDFGCRIKSDWLENLIAPFETDPQTEVVAGWYEAIDQNGQPVFRRGWVSLSLLNPKTFLPSSRSLAFSKTVWGKVGGYPEWLTLTGEDTYFDLELKRSTRYWAFVPEAVVQWNAPLTLGAYWKKLYNWSLGDGEVGTNASTYRWALLKLIASCAGIGGIIAWTLLFYIFRSLVSGLGLLVWLAFWLVVLLSRARKAQYTLSDLLWESGAPFAQVMGFLVGLRRRSRVYERRLEFLKGTFFILSGIPINDTGGGARCTQIALELLRRQWLVVFINKYPSYENKKLNIDIRHPNLITRNVEKFSLEEFIQVFGEFLKQKKSGVLIEFPLVDFIPMFDGFKKCGSRIIYDMLDDWNTSLGASWYSEKTEKTIIDRSDILIATAGSLLKRQELLAGRPAIFLPNAVNSYVFDVHQVYSRPDDLPSSVWSMIYIGALWGEWFDWQLLNKIAKRYPEGDVVVIGDYQGQCPEELPNVHFLGLKAQRELPAYLYHSSVAIIPWKVTPITQATSPLKVYEYIAMGKPVVAPNIQTLSGLPGVYLAQDDEDFIAKVVKLRGQSIPLDIIARFVEDNDWKARVNQLLGLLQ